MQESLITILLWLNSIVNLLMLFIIGMVCLVIVKTFDKKEKKKNQNNNPKVSRGLL